MEVEIKSVEVVLKKTKITKSILSQSKTLRIEDLIIHEFESIGWCNDGKSKYFIFYNSNRIFKIQPFTNAIIIKEIHEKRKFEIEENEIAVVINPLSIKPIIETFSFPADAENFAEKINKIRGEILTKGQFYL